ncbi:hypothetical protein Hte_007185 [Hypoxylon texense]
MDEDSAIPPGLPLYAALPLPTQPRSIRVLDLEPSVEYNDPLIGTLRIVSLDEKECSPFYALSYAWGDAVTNRNTLWLGGTANCYEALRQIRHNYGATTIWVDAVCINQADDREKELQLPLMAEVYMWAEVVYIWLGADTEASLRALRRLARAAARSSNHLPIAPDRASRIPPNWSEKAKFALKLLQPYLIYNLFRQKFLFFRAEVYRAQTDRNLADLLTRPWFSRAWTLQEVVLASNAVILCGPATYRLEVIFRGLESPGYRWVRRRTHVDFWGALWLWFNINRPTERNGHRVRRQLSSKHSFRNYEKPYNDIYSFIQVSWHRYYIGLIENQVFVPPFYFFLGPDGLGVAGSVLLFVLLVLTAVLSIVINMAELPKRRLKIEQAIAQSNDEAIVDSLIQALRQRHTGVSKDRCYALYGILANLGADLPRPDYRKTKGQVYHELFVHLMRWKPSFVSLLIDCCQETGGRDPEMGDTPTWVPDWNKIADDDLSTYQFFLADRREMVAKLGQTPYIRLSTNLRELFVRGQWAGIGQLVFCTDKFEKVEGLTEDMNGHCFEITPNNIALLSRSLTSIVDWINTARYIQPGDSSGRLDRESLDIMSTALWKPSVDSLHAMYEVILQAESNIQQGHPPSVDIGAITQTILQNRGLLKYCVRVITDLSDEERRLFVTSDGTVGLAYRQAAIDDRLALVEGVPAPLLLRPSKSASLSLPEDGYEVISPAWVDRWSWGEALKLGQPVEIKIN